MNRYVTCFTRFNLFTQQGGIFLSVKGRGSCRQLCCSFKPVAVGFLLAITVTLIMLALSSLILALIECVTSAAVIPLSLISLACGCFAGAYACALLTCRRGLLHGAIIAGMLFVLIYMVGLFSSELSFGSESAIKLFVLLSAGCCGGYLGVSGRGRR